MELQKMIRKKTILFIHSFLSAGDNTTWIEQLQKNIGFKHNL